MRGFLRRPGQLQRLLWRLLRALPKTCPGALSATALIARLHMLAANRLPAATRPIRQEKILSGTLGGAGRPIRCAVIEPGALLYEQRP